MLKLFFCRDAFIFPDQQQIQVRRRKQVYLPWYDIIIDDDFPVRRSFRSKLHKTFIEQRTQITFKVQKLTMYRIRRNQTKTLQIDYLNVCPQLIHANRTLHWSVLTLWNEANQASQIDICMRRETRKLLSFLSSIENLKSIYLSVFPE